MQKKLSFKEIKINDKVEPLTVIMDKEKYKIYNRIANEINPLHFNKKYAKSLEFEDIVIAGVYTYSFFPKMIVDWTKNPNSLKKIQIRFIAPAYPEDIVTHKGIVTNKYETNDEKIIECDVWAENQNGKKLTSAKVVLLFE